MTKPESLPVEEARKKFADILDGTQFRSTHTEITRRGKAAGVVVPPEWYDEAVEALTEKRRKAAGSPPSAAATPRVQVSEPLPPEPELTEPTATVPLPEMSPREIHKVIKRAMTRAKPDQRERLNLTAKNAEQLGRDRDGTLLRTALEMGLLKHDEVYAEPERPAASEEQTA